MESVPHRLVARKSVVESSWLRLQLVVRPSSVRMGYTMKEQEDTAENEKDIHHHQCNNLQQREDVLR